jgi:hypothetical protein
VDTGENLLMTERKAGTEIMTGRPANPLNWLGAFIEASQSFKLFFSSTGHSKSKN